MSNFITKSELRIEVERLRDKNKKLQAENEKLQAENTRLRSWISVDAKNVRQILRENIELRNLFYEAWEWMQYARWHDLICADKLDAIGIKASKLGFPHYELFNCAFAAAEFDQRTY